MDKHHEKSTRRSSFTIARNLIFSYITFLVCILCAAPSRAMDAEALPGFLERKVERARPLIRERIKTLPACHALFTELGENPLAVLAALRLRPASLYQERQICRGRHAAFTSISSPVIYFCRSFARLPDRQAATILIHEALHTAGLKEKPADPQAMDSAAINEMVATHCQL